MQLDLLAAVRDALADRYAVEAEVGRGGMAIVCRARDLRHDRLVAIKVLQPDLARAVGGERFLREIDILARLSHPNILPLLDSGSFEISPGLSLPWYVMPFVSEETLRARLTREGALPVPLALRYTEELCSALAHAHAGGYIHRDIKPENILLQADHAILADFGIARAVTVAAGDNLSSTGVVIGTPAYMSPEQSVGSDRLDARSDLYSLGVVLYEMLAGHPPFAGSSPLAISARHQFEQPPPIDVVRPGLAPGVQAVVERALAKVPADRVQTAGELADALRRAPQAVVPPAPPARPRRWWQAAAAIGALAIVIWLSRSGILGGVKLDPARFVVLPFSHRGSTPLTVINSGECEELVSDALTRWTDLGVVSSLTVGSALATSNAPLTLRKAVALARGLGAGRVVWGEVSELADTVRVQGVLYDASLGTELRSYTIRFAATTADLGVIARRFADLTYALVLPGNPTPEAAADALGAKSLAAWRTYAAGDSALNEWNLDLAKKKYHDALTLDPEYPNANLKLAQVGAWLDDPAVEWRPYAERAMTSEDRLDRSSRVMARGLLALADERYPTACGRYRELLARDSLDFRGWFGLGECLTRDNVVLGDSSSPSRWRFRTSYREGIAAYTRALTIVPSAHLAYGGAALRRLAAKLYADPDRIRTGQTENARPEFFSAYPSLNRDTLAFIPYPAVSTVAGTNLPSTWAAALDANRRNLLSITSSWLTRFPGSRTAILSQSQALEISGQIDGPSQAPSALGLIRQLRRSPLGRSDVDLVVREIRLLVKTRRYTAARALAESALAVPPRTVDEGMAQAGLAALIGRTDRAADLSAEFAETLFVTPTGDMVDAPMTVARDANRLLAYASFGEPAESLHAIATRIRRNVLQQVEPRRREPTLEAVLFQPSLLGFPVVSRSLPGSFPIAVAENSLARGDRQAARSALEGLTRLLPPELVPAVAPDFALLEARLWALAGDSAAARRRVDVMLGTPTALDADFLSRVSQAAAIGRAMEFRRGLGPDGAGLGLDSAIAGLWGGNRAVRRSDGQTVGP